MFEYHGWITIQESATDDDPTRLTEIVDSLRHYIDEIASPYLLDLRWMNGEPFIHIGGMSNHRTSNEIFDLFSKVSTTAPGSYGLLHVRDDEDPAHENEVRVLRLARGILTRHTELLLSPCIPTLEDPLRGNAPGAAGLPRRSVRGAQVRGARCAVAATVPARAGRGSPYRCCASSTAGACSAVTSSARPRRPRHKATSPRRRTRESAKSGVVTQAKSWWGGGRLSPDVQCCRKDDPKELHPANSPPRPDRDPFGNAALAVVLLVARGAHGVPPFQSS